MKKIILLIIFSLSVFCILCAQTEALLRNNIIAEEKYNDNTRIENNCDCIFRNKMSINKYDYSTLCIESTPFFCEYMIPQKYNLKTPMDDFKFYTKVWMAKSIPPHTYDYSMDQLLDLYSDNGISYFASGTFRKQVRRPYRVLIKRKRVSFIWFWR